MDLLIKHARIRNREETVDIAIEDGKITAMEPKISGDAAKSIDAEGRLVFRRDHPAAAH